MDHLLHLAHGFKLQNARCVLLFFIFFISSSSRVQSQQPYIGNGNGDCVGPDSSTTSGLGYTCNGGGGGATCLSYLIFRSQPPTYVSVSSISNLLSVDAAQLARLNSVSENYIFPGNRTVLIPVNCSCSGRFSQHNASYVIQQDDALQKVANNVYKGLSTCRAIRAQNPGLIERNISVGTRIEVPLRCACPTRNQTDSGVRFLLSYLVASGDFVATIAPRFGADLQETFEANGLSDQDSAIFPDTTLLLPLRTVPSSSQIVDPPPPPSGQSTPPPSGGGGGGSSKTWIYALAGALGGVSIISTSLLLFICLRNRKRKAQKRDSPVIVSESYESVEKPLAKKGPTEDMASSDSFWDSMSSIAQSMTVYTYEELRLATDDFSSDCLIGGSVYLGTIKGDLAAIKKVSRNVSEEINLLNKINHLNLIRLSGVSFFDGFWFLVFEFAENGSLDDWIYGNKADKEKKADKVLSWMQRMQIAFDVASGLNYLHSYTSPPHVHKDLKCSNVLLDAEFRAKITNFGLARSTDSQGGQFALTRHIVGTKGYMAPEYLENGLVSPKLDVYSFGVLLLEILTGKEVALNSRLAESLASVLDDQKDGKEMVGDFMDGSLGGSYPSDLAVMVINLTDSCLKKDPSARPGMHDIVQTLSTTLNASISWESELRASN